MMMAVPSFKMRKRGKWIMLKCPRSDCGALFIMPAHSVLHRQYATIPCPGCFRVAYPGTLHARPREANVRSGKKP